LKRGLFDSLEFVWFLPSVIGGWVFLVLWDFGMFKVFLMGAMFKVGNANLSVALKLLFNQIVKGCQCFLSGLPEHEFQCYWMRDFLAR